MNQLGDGLEAAGFSPDDVTKLRAFAGLKTIKAVLNGYAKIEIVKHLVDLDANPFVPDGWKVEEHTIGGQFEWSPTAVALYLSTKQQNGGVIGGHDLRKEMKNQRVFNANLLDFLLANPHLIPEEWKGKYVFFWGTIYRSSDGNLCVRFLRWVGDEWFWYYSWLDSAWNADYPAAVPASN